MIIMKPGGAKKDVVILGGNPTYDLRISLG